MWAFVRFMHLWLGEPLVNPSGQRSEGSILSLVRALVCASVHGRFHLGTARPGAVLEGARKQTLLVFGIVVVAHFARICQHCVTMFTQRDVVRRLVFAKFVSALGGIRQWQYEPDVII